MLNENLDATFSALADPTRRAILQRLSLGEVSVSELAEPFDISLPAISRHLRVLEGADLLEQVRQGKFRYCRLKPQALSQATEYLEFYRRFWAGTLDRLDAHLIETRSKTNGKRASKRRK